MNPIEHVELKRQVNELLDKGYIRESLSPYGVPPYLLLRRMGRGECVWTTVQLIRSQSSISFPFQNLMTC